MGSRTVAAGNSRPVWRCAAVALAAIGAAAMLPTSHGAYVYLPVHTHHHLVGAAQKLARLKLGRLQKLPRAPYASTNKYHPRPRRTYTGKAVREPPPPSYDYDYDDYPDYSSAEFGLTPEEAQCTAVEAVQEVEIAGCTDIHARAVAEVFETVCDEKAVSLEQIEEVFMKQDAVAFAQATAAAIVECTSSNDDAFVCGTITVSAQAFANTTVQAHVEATAAAVRGCGCQDEITAFGSSDTFISLVAEATATATASACIEGSGRVVASEYSTCTSSVFAKVFARLEADAMDVAAESTCGGLAFATVDGERVSS